MKLSDIVKDKRAINRFSTLEIEFLNIQFNKYTYEEAVYVNLNTSIKITCPKHGIFEQKPIKHLNGQGCPKCSGKNKELIDFINEANSIHNTCYDYSKSIYTNATTKLNIICKIHGEFKITPNSHLGGQGCPKCRYLKSANSNKKFSIETLHKLAKVHNNKYIYCTNLQNIGMKEKIFIWCPIHGPFEQLIANHLKGCGCPSCAEYGFNPNKPAILYYLSINNGQAYKIGITNRTIKERFSMNKGKITILFHKNFELGARALKLEQWILKRYSKYKYNGVPLLTDGNTELFNIDISKGGIYGG